MDDDQKTSLFLNKMKTALNSEGTDTTIEYNEEHCLTFCIETGSAMPKDARYGEAYAGVLKIIFNHARSLKEFLAYYMAFVNSIPAFNLIRLSRQYFLNMVRKMMEQCHIKYDIIQDNDGYYIFPKGAKELDDVLVSQPLEWLSTYPKGRAAFVKALKSYSDATAESASEVADKFRKALEAFMQEFFGMEKSLENLKSAYGDYMRKRGVPAEVSKNFETLLQAYTNFINGYAKHQDRTQMNVLEYIMYQTGNIIRLLVMLKREETGYAN